MTELDEYRNTIDEIDNELVRLFEQRLQTVLKIAEYKEKKHLPVLDAGREELVIQKNLARLSTDAYEQETVQFFQAIMAITKNVQSSKIKKTNYKQEHFQSAEVKADPRVGYYGAPGSFCEEAMFHYFETIGTASSYAEFEDVFQSLTDGKIDYAVLPIENSSTGSIAKVYDLLNESNCSIIGEQLIKINQHLVGLKGSDLGQIKEVYSHQQGFEQSTTFLKPFGKWKLIPYRSTSESAKRISEDRDISKAAISSRRAAAHYGLAILKENIHNSDQNTTRFVILSRELEFDQLSDKITVVFSLDNQAGTLHRLLHHFAENQLNLVKIESRPQTGKNWHYLLYADLEGNLLDPRVQQAFHTIQQYTSYFRMIGNYRMGTLKG